MIMGTLVVLDRASREGADKVQAFFNPALNWIQRWLPLFYVPTLVVLPQAVQGIAGAPGAWDRDGLRALNVGFHSGDRAVHMVQGGCLRLRRSLSWPGPSRA